jgi:uncharacterized protein YvpB
MFVIKKPKKVTFLMLVVGLTATFIIWIGYEFSLSDDPKGKVNIVKKIYYQMTTIVPVHPAVNLKVAFHRQEHALSCEVAALRMALLYRGVKVTENELIAQLPISDPNPRNLKDNTWGDPNLGFVGNINGRMPNSGYGVYEQPIYNMASKYRNARIITNGSIADLTTELANGNPVVVWGVIGKGKDISWKTPEGKVITAKLDEHARTLIGFTGKSDNPKLMILLDPIYGEIRLSISAFQKNWDMLAKKAVVIY